MDNKKSLIALALVAVVGLVGVTYAYFTSTATLNNSFTTGTYSTSVKEEFVSPNNWTPGTTTTKKVNVTNNGSVEVAIRAKYTEKWTAADGTDLPLTRDGLTIAQFEVNSNWIAATDGYYYYKGTLTKGQTSSDFISSVTFNPNFELLEEKDVECTTSTADGKTTNNCTSLTTGYAGATYSLDIMIETIQADQIWYYIAFEVTPSSTEITEMQAIDSNSYVIAYSDELRFLYYTEDFVSGEVLVLLYMQDNIMYVYAWEDSLDSCSNYLGVSMTEEGWYKIVFDSSGKPSSSEKVDAPPTITSEEQSNLTVYSKTYLESTLDVE